MLNSNFGRPTIGAERTIIILTECTLSVPTATGTTAVVGSTPFTAYLYLVLEKKYRATEVLIGVVGARTVD